jgi:hypothetical protein
MPSNATTNHFLSSTDYTAGEFGGQWADVDHPDFYFDPGFKQFCDQKLRELEQLPAGWDYAGAPPIDRQVLGAVRDFVAALPQHIAVRPMVVPLSSGNVQLEWHHGRLALELEFESPDEVHYLKWDPDHQVEEEDVIPASCRDKLVGMIRWFMKGMLNG